MEILRDGTFAFNIDGESLSKGLRPSKRIARNSKFMVECVGAVGKDKVLSVLEDLESGRIDTSIITDSFPYPQIFVLVNFILICGSTEIYTYDGSTMTLQIDVGTSGLTWSVVESYDYIYMSNCAVAVVRDPLSGTFSISNLPAARAMCNYNGQVIISECQVPVPAPTCPQVIAALRTGIIGDPLHEITDTVWLYDSNFSEITHYGERGTGDDQLFCAVSITVDCDYVYIGDWRNDRIMVRSTTDLSYIQSISFTVPGYTVPIEPRGLHSDGNYLYYSGSALLKLDRETGAIITDIESLNGCNSFYEDLTNDENYLYVVDTSMNKIQLFDINTLLYYTNFGRIPRYTGSDTVCYFDGSYIYHYDIWHREFRKEDISDWSHTFIREFNTTETVPHIEEMLFYNNKLYTVDFFTDKVYTIDLTTLEFTYIFTYDNTDIVGYSIAVDANHIYIGGYAGFHRYDTGTYAFVDSSGDFTYTFFNGPNAYDQVWALCIDATYVYVMDWATPLRIVRRLKSDLSYVDEYSDIADHIQDPRKMTTDGTYLYVSDQHTTEIHRINKATMTYVDHFDSSYVHPQQMSISGTTMAVALYSGYLELIDISTLAQIDITPLYDTYDSDHHMYPSGITVDEDRVYITNAYTGSGTSILGTLAIYDKSTFALVTRIEVYLDHTSLYLCEPAVDDYYIYIPVRIDNGSGYVGYIYRYNKSTFAFIDRTVSTEIVSIDTTYGK